MPMRETLDQLTKTAEALNRESDELNAVIEDFEEQLEQAGVGVSAWLNQRNLLDDSDWVEKHDYVTDKEWFECTGWQLGYTKLDGKWRIAVKRVKWRCDTMDSDDDGYVVPTEDPIPLAKAPRVVRVSAAPLLENLALLITAQMERYLDGIRSAKNLVKNS